ncbi:MAG: hypothetical protein SVM79_02005 [Chloroflexota bacterium]|nr:hypothetical protein [Chloroflexota bacterium]
MIQLWMNLSRAISGKDTRSGVEKMIGKERAQELHRRYKGLEFPIDSEDIAIREGLEVVTWPFLSSPDEIKFGRSIGIREGLSSDWRRWDIAHALGHHILMHKGNQLVLP